MCASGWPITLLLFATFGSATSSPVSVYTPAPPFPSQISPPSASPTIRLHSHSSRIPPLISNSEESTKKISCPLTMSVSPSALVVRYVRNGWCNIPGGSFSQFGDPATANCSVQRMGFSGLGWMVSLATPETTTDNFLVWSVDRMTEWNIEAMCYALSDHGGQCVINLPVMVYKPPDNVSIGLVNHTGAMFEGHHYTLQCTVQDVAPIANLTVIFYKGQTPLGTLQSHNKENGLVTETFTLNITPSKDDDGVQYWCEAKLLLGPNGPLHPPVVTSEKFPATILFGPQLVCPTKVRVREGESLRCEVRGNPQPLVTWYRDGQVVVLPARSSRKHAGKYTVIASGPTEQKNFTVEVEVLGGSGTTNGWNRYFLLTIMLVHMIKWL